MCYLLKLKYALFLDLDWQLELITHMFTFQWSFYKVSKAFSVAAYANFKFTH